MRWSAVLPSCGTVFDISGKQSLRANLNAQMGKSSFLDNPEKAQQVIQQLKPLNALLKPYEDLQATVGDVEALAELAEEDASLETELESELAALDKRLSDFELQAMLSGPQDASNAYLRIQAG